MKFKNNKYTKWYFTLVNKAKTQNRRKFHKTNINYVYYEKHHIIPKSLGGNNNHINLVLLTAREHFICHLLLTKMVVNFNHIKKMERALSRFICNNNNMERKLTPREYEISKSLSSKSKVGIKHSLERNEKIRQTMLQKWKHDENYKFKQIKNLEKIKNTKEYKENHRKGCIDSHKSGTRKRKIKLPTKYKDIIIFHPIKNISKTIKNNQVPQYKKYGWIIAF